MTKPYLLLALLLTACKHNEPVVPAPTLTNSWQLDAYTDFHYDSNMKQIATENHTVGGIYYVLADSTIDVYYTPQQVSSIGHYPYHRDSDSLRIKFHPPQTDAVAITELTANKLTLRERRKVLANPVHWSTGISYYTINETYFSR
jgi:hypothetical protein